MSGIKGVMKEGWRPKGKDGGKESWRGDFKGINQVAGWMGKGKDSSSDRAEHASRPLSSLKDPSSFGPPPKHINYHGPAAVSNGITPDRRGLGAPLSREQIAQQEEERAQAARAEAEAEQASRRPAPPPVPFRADTTGLSTDSLPPPPRRINTPDTNSAPQQPPQSRPKPSLPPRLPPRTSSNTSHSPSPPPAYDHAVSQSPSTGHLNQGALNRLGKAGVSVPGLGVGGSGSTPDADRAESPAKANAGGNAQLSELQSRFSRMSTTSSNAPGTPPAQGTTVEQKQAAVHTAQQIHKDPSSVSVNDARSAASTANNFRERHQDQISAGKKKWQGINEKYGISKRINNFIEDQKSPAEPEQGASQTGQAPLPPPHPNANPQYGHQQPSNMNLDALNKRKAPPPPPPPKKRSIQSAPVNSQSSPPPPLPLGTKPRQ